MKRLVKISTERGVGLEAIMEIYDKFSYKLTYERIKAKESLDYIHKEAKELTLRYFKRFYKKSCS